MSLDRVRSRNTAAAQIRSARAAGRIAPESNTFLEKDRSISFIDSSELRDIGAGGSRDQSSVKYTDKKFETNGIHTVRKTDDGAKGKNESKSSSTSEDVFEFNSQKITLKTAEWKKEMLSAPSATSVKNKISQFEALSQRNQGYVPMPRRAMSAPTHLISGSTKPTTGGLKDKWEGSREGEGAGVKPERSLSVDENGLRRGKKEREGNDLVENEWEKRSNNCGEEFGKYSRLKRALEIPLNGGVQRQPQHFFIDETDFSKVFSPEEASEKDLSTNNKTTVLVSSDTSTGVPKKSPCVVSSPLSDDDKTPTNTPNHSPFLSPTTQPENVIPTAYRYDSTSVFTKSVKSPDPQSPPLPCPLATFSHSSLPEPISPDVNTAYQKGKKRVLDLDAWVAGLSSDIKVCNDTEDEDDDESTQKDEDSNYDSDSGESSVTITSSTSQSEHMSFCVNLSDLYNFAGVEYESENDSDDWRSTGQRSMSVSSDVSILSCVSLMPTEELDRLLEDVRNLGDNTRQDYDDVQVVVLHKEIGVGLGFSVAGGMDQNKPVTVHKVFHLGVAAQEGSIREGDQVLSINGTALCGCTHWEAVRVLRRAKTREMGVVVLKRGDVNSAFTRGVQESNQGPTQTQSIETDQCVCVHLEKNSRDLGFSLEGGVGSSLGNRPLTVQKIFQGGPVDKVFPGDEVVEIEGMSMVAMSRLEAWTFIRRLPPGPVDIVLRRPLKHLET
uniref:pro-interleukin-16 n=1 Tax=Monopterus albus TaxID=43700 RepID=UPI0009B4ACAB|nr:pro-interleukin-16-like [Monopterus albus]